MRFTLEINRWYACELVGDEFDNDKCSYSPIRVLSLETSGTGKRVFSLGFYHANYPEGVRDKLYTLQTIERGRTYILARSTAHDPTRFLLCYDIDWEWLTRHFKVEPEKQANIQRWLGENV